MCVTLVEDRMKGQRRASRQLTFTCQGGSEGSRLICTVFKTPLTRGLFRFNLAVAQEGVVVALRANAEGPAT